LSSAIRPKVPVRVHHDPMDQGEPWRTAHAHPISIFLVSAEFCDFLPRHLQLENIRSGPSRVSAAIACDLPSARRRVRHDVVSQEPSPVGRLYDLALFLRHAKFQVGCQEVPDLHHYLVRILL